MIEVRRTGEGDPLEFEVVVREGQGESRHHVTIAQQTGDRLTAGKHTPERCVEAAARYGDWRERSQQGMMAMKSRALDPGALGRDEDWEGNNAAFTCPRCQKVFIVSGQIHRGHRDCPGCHKSIGRVSGGRKSGGTASIEWPEAD
jgi:hypothetical protein